MNGQAPPGVKRVEEVGEWRCFNCGGVNGKDEGKRIVEDIMGGEEGGSDKGGESEKGEEDGVTRREKEASEEVEVEEQIKAGLKEGEEGEEK